MIDEMIIAMLKCKGIGNATVCKYIIDNDFNESKIKINIADIIKGEEQIKFDQYMKEAKDEINRNLEFGIKIITMLDKQFPSKLYTIKNPVVYLYYKGDISLLNTPSIGIIGSRNVEKTSLINAEKAGYYFSINGISVVSGLALGIDVNSHIGVLNAKGKAIAVLPSDLLNIVPNSNRGVADGILGNGGLLISEYSIGYKMDRYCYANRDRIQSALSEVILVIEANENSGTMIAVKKSIAEGKMVCQLKTNNNTIIKDKVDLDEDGQYLVDKVIKEYKKWSENKNEQISLF